MIPFVTQIEFAEWKLWIILEIYLSLETRISPGMIFDCKNGITSGKIYHQPSVWRACLKQAYRRNVCLKSGVVRHCSSWLLLAAACCWLSLFQYAPQETLAAASCLVGAQCHQLNHDSHHEQHLENQENRKWGCCTSLAKSSPIIAETRVFTDFRTSEDSPFANKYISTSTGIWMRKHIPTDFQLLL